MKRIFKKIAFIAFLLSLVAGTIAFVYFERGSFSEADLRVEIRGPEEVEVGEVVEYSIIYRNNSDIRLENVLVDFEYPSASVPVEEREDELVEERETFRRRKELDDLNPGQEEVIDFKARIFGMEGDSVEAKAWFNYSPQNLSAQYEAERTHTGVITDVPISFEFDLPDQKEADEEFPFRVRYLSRLSDDIENLGIRLDYPSGFEFLRSTPRGLENNEWEREVLETGDGAVIEVFGKLDGEPGDVKGFAGELGVWKFDRFITLKEISGEVLIPQPNLFVDVLVNDSADYVAEAGEDLFYEVFFKNIGNETMENLFLNVGLDREILNMDETEPMEGRFQPESGTIIWSHSSVSELRRLRPDDEETISFWSKVNNDLPYNPEASVSVNLGQARYESRIKVESKIDLEQQFLVGNEDPLRSDGPFPFEDGTDSNYSVSWKLINENNDLEDVEVVATLPDEVYISDYQVEDGQELDFDSSSGQLIWSLEEVERGAGISLTSPELIFQVEIDSSLDEDATLVEDVKVSAEDLWTSTNIEKEINGLTYLELLDLAGVDFDESPRRIEIDEDEENNEDN